MYSPGTGLRRLERRCLEAMRREWADLAGRGYGALATRRLKRLDAELARRRQHPGEAFIIELCNWTVRGNMRDTVLDQNFMLRLYPRISPAACPVCRYPLVHSAERVITCPEFGTACFERLRGSRPSHELGIPCVMTLQRGRCEGVSAGRDESRL